MSDFQDPTDSTYTAVYKRETPDLLAKFAAFDEAVFAAEGRAIPLKFRELMAIAVALTTQCPYCIDFHTGQAVRAGATDEEIAETAWVATALRAGAAFTHGRLAFKLTEQHRH